jgi:hypothetical protein
VFSTLPVRRFALQKSHSARTSVARLAALGAAAAVVLPGEALAHVTISPTYVEADVTSRIVFETPNERPPHATVALAIDAPPGVAFSAAEPPPGWKLDLSTTRVVWSGGRIDGRRTIAFPIRVLARTRAGNQVFRAVQRYDDGEEVRWPATLSVLPTEGAEAPSQHLGRAIAAAAAGLVVIGVSFLGLRLVRGRASA